MIIANPERVQPPTWAETMQEPEWPRAAFETSVEGEVTLGCVVDTAGRARVCEIVAETPEGFGFGEAVMANVASLRFHPARFNDEAIESRIQFGVNFRFAETQQASPELNALLMTVAEAISAQGYAAGSCRHRADPATVQHWDAMQIALREHPNAEYRFYDRMFTEGYRAGREFGAEYSAQFGELTVSQCADVGRLADRYQTDAAPAFSQLEALSFPGEMQQYWPSPDGP
tara:strand:- start:114 stop:803 length:690 start_codon:yes stop_codon:yes gene_type:complete